MAIYNPTTNGFFSPNEIKVTEAYEGALIDLCIADREDPITELIAKSILNVTATGEQNPLQVKRRAVNALGIRKPSAA
jgi:hypothetical protein